MSLTHYYPGFPQYALAQINICLDAYMSWEAWVQLEGYNYAKLYIIVQRQQVGIFK